MMNELFTTEDQLIVFTDMLRPINAESFLLNEKAYRNAYVNFRKYFITDYYHSLDAYAFGFCPLAGKDQASVIYFDTDGKTINTVKKEEQSAHAILENLNKWVYFGDSLRRQSRMFNMKSWKFLRSVFNIPIALFNQVNKDLTLFVDDLDWHLVIKKKLDENISTLCDCLAMIQSSMGAEYIKFVYHETPANPIRKYHCWSMRKNVEFWQMRGQVKYLLPVDKTVGWEFYYFSICKQERVVYTYRDYLEYALEVKEKRKEELEGKIREIEVKYKIKN